jgi:23S rRNA pseudouridine2605 synthase
VEINGEVVTQLGLKVDPLNDMIRVDGEKVVPETLRFYQMYKPAQVVCTMSDERGRRCVGDLVKRLPVSVFPVGRLDYDVTGLLLLTNDGDFAHGLLHPSFNTVRHYLARVMGSPTSDALAALTQGVEMDDGLGRALSVVLIDETQAIQELLGPKTPGTSILELEVGEGRKHFVKRILETVGYPVQRLCRTSFGPFSLGALQPGEIVEIPGYRQYLTNPEA